jgi:hypothetical protein
MIPRLGLDNNPHEKNSGMLGQRRKEKQYSTKPDFGSAKKAFT